MPFPFLNRKLQVLTKNLKDSSLFNADSKLCYCPSARCTMVANKSVETPGVFDRKSILLNDLLNLLC